MSHTFLLRLLFDFVAAGLLIAALAYWWLDNTAHELIGTGMFFLILVHNFFNRRWYGRIARDRREPRGLVTIGLNLSLLMVMVALLVTSVVISRSLFGFLPFDGGMIARDIHLLAAYWAVVLVGIHVGLNWSIVINVFRSKLAVTTRGPIRMGVLRLAAVGVAAKGVQSSFEMALGSKLVRHITLDM